MRLKLTVLLTLALIASAAYVGCRRGASASELAGHNVLLITLDTTRADRIGCYGYEKAETPAIDGVAARGALFEQAIAQVQLTLPSHSSILTGRYPRELGVRDNARNALGPEHPTLAEVFKEKGYRTGAFVAAFVLDSQFGLDRGFDIYSDDMDDRHVRHDPLHAQQPANVISDRALAWLNEEANKPFFAWIHYYDPHDPYTPPEPFRGPDRLPYDGEIAFMDSQIARILQWLEARRLTDNTLVVIVGDHGESFGEHGERGHTNFIYETNLLVPLIFAHPKVISGPKRNSSVVEIMDVFPTILELFGVEPPPRLHSRSLVPAFSGRKLAEKSAYSESLYVFNSYGWAEQRSLTTPRWKYISSTKAELYDRKADPGEMKNLLLDEPRVASDMLDQLKRRYESMPVGAGGAASLTPEAIESLRSLGYLQGRIEGLEQEEFLSEGRRDPKDMTQVLELHRMAKAMSEKAKTEEDYVKIVPLFRDVLAMCPEALQFQYSYGFALLKAGQPEKAMIALDAAIAIDPTHRHSIELKAEALAKLGRHAEAVKELEAAKKMNPNSATTRFRLARALEQSGQIEKAVIEYRESLRLDPSRVNAIARICALVQDQSELRQIADRYSEIVKQMEEEGFELHGHEGGEDSDDARIEAYFDLGLCFTRISDYGRATAAFQKVLEISPEHDRAKLNLGIAFLAQGETVRAKSQLEQVARSPGLEAEAYFHLGAVAIREGNADEAVRLMELAVASNPSYTAAVAELAVYYHSKKQFADMIRILKLGAEGSPDDVWILNGLGQILATSSSDELRECALATTVLSHAAELSARQDANILSNLSAALACEGQFDPAIRVAKEALAKAAARQNTPLIKRIEEQIELATQGKDFRDSKM